MGAIGGYQAKRSMVIGDTVSFFVYRIIYLILVATILIVLGRYTSSTIAWTIGGFFIAVMVITICYNYATVTI
jgi:hypothetical protein